MEVVIRKAQSDDAGMIAWAVQEALDLPHENLDRFAQVCKSEAALYSWRNTFVAQVDGQNVGALIAYDGARYMEMRRYTWPLLWTDFDAAELEGCAIETGKGEFYIDTFALLPQWRARGIGRRLMQHVLANVPEGLRPTLIVSEHKPNLQRYYEGFGFEPKGQIDFFGHRYNKLFGGETGVIKVQKP